MKRPGPKELLSAGPETPLTAILQALRQSPEPLSGEVLAARLGLSRAAVWKRINRLKALGYAIEGSPRRGYRLLDVQFLTPHLASLGAVEIPRSAYLRRLRAALKAETRRATVLIVAQRVGTILNADRIVVLAEGTIAGVGTHAELLETCETYREIVYSQLTPEEAA